jgi:3-isopropylmalate/(R)-2-methylmalate dehydratase small subunit
VLPEEQVNELITKAQTHPGYRLTVSLQAQIVRDADGFQASFEVEPFRRHCLLKGLDDIELTLQQDAKITAYESTRSAWLTRG